MGRRPQTRVNVTQQAMVPELRARRQVQATGRPREAQVEKAGLVLLEPRCGVKDSHAWTGAHWIGVALLSEIRQNVQARISPAWKAILQTRGSPSGPWEEGWVCTRLSLPGKGQTPSRAVVPGTARVPVSREGPASPVATHRHLCRHCLEPVTAD